MRVAMFSPMPPARSGIADYSHALAGELAQLLDLEVFTEPRDPSGFDIALYQLGNNPHHRFVYETALAYPGVTVLHEANLHHLVADLTIRRGDWDTYLRECEYDGGPEALAYARKVRALEVGPDYGGVPMVRRVLERSRAVIVHSCYMIEETRAAGFHGPVERIPHGAWMEDGDRAAFRHRLGLMPSTPLIGVFGFLKPYKRIAESLRAFRRLLRVEPRARMILVGEPHPDLPVQSLIDSLGLTAEVRVLGFTPIEDFAGYMAACDIMLNLRYPTVGESSGSLQRALGLGLPALVSDVGSFRDLPDDVCLKVPVGPGEEDTIYEYLNLLVSRPEVAGQIGRRARAYAQQECDWRIVARRYAEFLEAVCGAGSQPAAAPPAALPERAESPPEPEGLPEPVVPEDVLNWTPEEPLFRAYVDSHLTRLLKTLEITPPAGPGDVVLEMGSYLQITPALRDKLGYAEVRGCYYGPAGTTDRRSVTSIAGERFECVLELFDAEKDTFPYADGAFATVLCCELIEHLFEDPMHMLSEVNRVLRPGGHLVLTTPNIASLRAISALLQGYHPGFFPQYIRPKQTGEVDPRHNREFTPREVCQLLAAAGFEVVRLETGEFRERPRPELAWVEQLLRSYKLPVENRGDGIYMVGRKSGPVRDRWPGWLYA